VCVCVTSTSVQRVDESGDTSHCSVLQRVAECCSVLQCAALHECAAR